MLHKLLIICLFTTTFTMVAMDEPAKYQIPVMPSGKSDAAEKAMKAAKEQHGILANPQDITYSVPAQSRPTEDSNDCSLSLGESLPDTAALSPRSQYEKMKALCAHEKKQLEDEANSVSKEPLVWSDEEKSTAIKALLEFPRICPTSGNTLLHYAATLPCLPDLIALVLEKNPNLKDDIDHHNKQGFSPYILALINENTAAAQILKDHGANLDWPKKMYFPDSQKTISIEQP